MDTIDRRGRKTPPPTRVLLVGAGAVGAVYGYHLKKAGAHVSFLVRPQYAEATRAGIRLYEMRGKRTRIPRGFVPDAVYGSVADAAEHEHDQVWLCLSTSALEKALAADLPVLLAAMGGAELVTLQPGVHVPELLAEHVSADCIIDGGISMVAYQAPLVSGEVSEPGIAFYLPFPSPFTGRGAEGLVSMLRAGGCPAEVHSNTRAVMAYGTATLNPLITALQGAGWKLAEMRKGRWAELGAKACGEARAVTEAQIGTPPPWGLGLVRSSTLQLASMLMPRVAPFELEIYLKYHFTKVGEQTRMLIHRFVEDGKDLGVEVGTLEELYTMVFGKTPGREAA